MRTGTIIHCRYDSKRLPGKILRRIGNKEVLLYMYERLKLSLLSDTVIVATSSEKGDDAIADHCRVHGIDCFRGAKEDVAGRLLRCAEERRLDYFVRICGDNIFADYRLLDEMIRIALKNDYNFVSNLKDRTFPAGISMEILKTSFFREIYGHLEDPKEKEHVTTYIYRHGPELPGIFYFYNSICPQAKDIKLALDDTEDLDFITKIVEKMSRDHTEYLLNDIYEISKQIAMKAQK